MNFLVDLHVHSDASPCSTLDDLTIVTETLAAGLDGVGLVDHDAFPPPQTVARIAESGVPVYPGVEISTPEGDVLLFGVASLPPFGIDAAAMARWAWLQGGVAIAAHPCRRSRQLGTALLALPQLIIETRNGRCTAEENRAAAQLAAGRVAVGGSDAHRPGEIGRFATAFPKRPDGTAALLQMLLAGACRPVTPFVTGGSSEPRTAAR